MSLPPGLKPTHVVEAALFSAGRALSLDEICEETGLARPAVRQAIDALAKTYKDRDTVLEVGKAGSKWAMQVRSRAAEPAARFAPMEIPKKTLKTLALIAYHQPIKQSDLLGMVGSKVYDHVKELHEHGLIKARRDGQTKILTTTNLFPEYFGLDAVTPNEVRRVLASAVGIDPDEKRAELPRSAAAPDAGPADDGDDTTMTDAVDAEPRQPTGQAAGPEAVAPGPS